MWYREKVYIRVNNGHINYSFYNYYRYEKLQWRFTMEKGLKFIGVCVLVASTILSASIVYYARYTSETNRYYFSSQGNGPDLVFDKFTGTYYYYLHEKYYEINPVNKQRIVR